MSAPHELFASCAPGIEPLLLAELAGLSVINPTLEAGGVSFRGHRAVLHRVNLASGLATHVLVRVDLFEARQFSELQTALERVPWELFLRPRVGRSFRVRARKSRLHHTGAIEERAALAIAKRLGDGLVAPDPAGVPVLLRLEHDRVQVSIDTSGAPLHRRGYRLKTSAAPLREDLARALILASGWDPTTPFVDPMCGSGTLLVEAASLARGLAPGRHRDFAFERTPLFHEPTWREVRAQAEAQALDAAPAPIIGGDRDAVAISATLENAARADVSGDLTVTCAPLSELDLSAVLDPAAPLGALVTNPPYGERLSPGADLSPLYRALGRRVSELPPAWRVAIMCAHRRLGLRVESDLRTAFVTDAGGLKVRALVRP